MAVLVAEVNVGKALEGYAESALLLSDHGRSSSKPVSGNVDALRGQKQDCHGTLNPLLCIQKAVYNGILLVDDGGDQLGGIDLSAAHLKKMNMALFIGLLDQFLLICYFAHCGDGIAAQVGLN